MDTAATFDTSKLLRTLPLFSALSEAELETVAARSVTRHAQAGECLFTRGEPCNSFHLLLQGSVKLVVSSPEGAERVIDIVRPGQSFGEACMFLGKPYMVSAEVVEDALLVRVPKRTVMEEIERNPDFAKRMLGGMSHRLHQLVGDFEALTLRSATQRVASYLLRCADAEAKDDGEFTLGVSKGLIAARLNITREHFSRVLHGLVSEGLVAVNGRVIRLLDRDRLTDQAI
ncbi:MAG TPA: Crp/Fnr family transcriptional regulator [Burkholderiales bacterium]|nr:Crp/Fnr family transcriptional regulator [Burkholderiales bacterium]